MNQLEEMRARMVEAKAGLKKGRKRVFVPPEVTDFRHGTVLAFDQTLTKTGWSYVQVDEVGIKVLGGGVLRPEIDPALRSFEQTFAKAQEMARAIAKVIWDNNRPDVTVHEMPAVRGYRLESSLMAAREIRRLSYPWPVVMISRQAAYSLIVGAPSAEKAKGTAAVNRLVPNWMRVTERWTQDVHDSVLLALVWLYDKEMPR